jgi:phosphoglucosamine mutase
MEMLQERSWIIGGESSGHIICLDRTTTGDAIIAALQVLQVLVKQNLSLRDAKSGMSKFPQMLINVPIQDKIDLDNEPQIQQAVKDAESDLADSGRVLLRPSGTEPLVRVMVEGEDVAKVQQLAQQIADTVSAAC